MRFLQTDYFGLSGETMPVSNFYCTLHCSCSGCSYPSMGFKDEEDHVDNVWLSFKSASTRKVMEMVFEMLFLMTVAATPPLCLAVLHLQLQLIWNTCSTSSD